MLLLFCRSNLSVIIGTVQKRSFMTKEDKKLTSDKTLETVVYFI
jgi:hypothetical protein